MAELANGTDVTSNENILPPDAGGSAPPAPARGGDSRSLSETITSAFDKSVPSEGAAPDAARRQDTPSEPARNDGRDAFGRFTPKEGAAPRTTPAQAPTPAIPAATAAVAANLGVSVDPNAAPASWAAERKADWAKVPAEVRPYLHQREKELNDGFQAIAQRSNVANAVLGEFAPYAETLRQEGATPQQAIRTLLQTAHALRNGAPDYKKAIFLSLAEQYGVDLSTPLNLELARAQAQVGVMETERMYGVAQQQTQAQQEVVRQFNAFANDPANKHFQKVRHVMGAIVGGGHTQSLKEAYDHAVWLVPEVRDLMLAEQRQAQVASDQARTAAAMSVTGAPNGRMVQGRRDGKQPSIRDSIEAAMGS